MIGQFGGLCILMGKLKAKGQKIYVFEENKKDSRGSCLPLPESYIYVYMIII